AVGLVYGPLVPVPAPEVPRVIAYSRLVRMGPITIGLFALHALRGAGAGWETAIAVPGSTAFAGEFLILAGIFNTGWGWAVVGASGIVLAAMYMLRLISAGLHENVGSAVPDEALALRPAELAVVVPLLGLLVALSVWHAGITEHLSF